MFAPFIGIAVDGHVFETSASSIRARAVWARTLVRLGWRVFLWARNRPENYGEKGENNEFTLPNRRPYFFRFLERRCSSVGSGRACRNPCHNICQVKVSTSSLSPLTAFLMSPPSHPPWALSPFSCVHTAAVRPHLWILCPSPRLSGAVIPPMPYFSVLRAPHARATCVADMRMTHTSSHASQLIPCPHHCPPTANTAPFATVPPAPPLYHRLTRSWRPSAAFAPVVP